MRLLTERAGGNGAAVGYRDLATGRPFLYRFLHAESRLSARREYITRWLQKCPKKNHRKVTKKRHF